MIIGYLDPWGNILFPVLFAGFGATGNSSTEACCLCSWVLRFCCSHHLVILNPEPP